MKNSYRVWKEYPVVAVDTEYDEQRIPFLATTADESLKPTVYRLLHRAEYMKFKALCENKKIVKIFHQCSADMFALSRIDIALQPPYEDTLIMASLINENYTKLGLKELARIFLREQTHTAKKLESVIKALKNKASVEGRMFSWRDIPDEIIVPYAKDDPIYTLKLFYLWRDEIRKYWSTYEFEKSIISIVVDLQKSGFVIDRTFVYKQMKRYEKEMSSIQKTLKKILRKYRIDCSDLSLRSPKQLSAIFQKLNAPLQKENKTGFSTDAEVLQELAVKKTVKLQRGDRETDIEIPRVVNQVAKYVLDYRFFNKHYSTYYEPLWSYYTSPENHVAFFEFYQSGAKTGRFSAELLQTFPRPEEARRSGHRHEVRRCVTCLPGECIISIDADQIEMRLFGHYTKSKRLIHAFETGLDPYVKISRDLFSQSLMEQSKELFKALRWLGKKIALGLIYGMGVKKLMWVMMYELPNIASPHVCRQIDMSEQKARKTLQIFYSLYPVREHMSKLIRQVYHQGELALKIKSPLLYIDRVYRIPHQYAYKAVNVEIQGTAAYVLKAMMKRCHKAIETIPDMWTTNTRMIGTVHDELLFYSSLGAGIEERVRTLIAAMEDHITFRVPITVSAKVGRSWGDVKEWNTVQSIKQLLQVA